MITIDGSYGESGGQILRTAVGLAALLKKPIKITNIRRGRCTPGLRMQHLTGVKVAGEFCNAEVKGLEVGSEEIEFVPGALETKNKKIDIGTAGSVSLLLQTLLPILGFSDKTVELEIVGGTDGLWAPPILYFKNVTLPLLAKLGINASVEVVEFGFYPKGQGKVNLKFEPIKKLRSIELIERGDIEAMNCFSLVGSLPEDIAVRQADAAKKILAKDGYDVKVETWVVRSASPGTSINLWAKCENSILGANAIGERGKRAEVVGEEAAESLIKSLKSGAALDRHMTDQIIPFLALAEGRSAVKVEEITEHCRTNIFVTEKFLGVKFELDENKKVVAVDGIGFTRL